MKKTVTFFLFLFVLCSCDKSSETIEEPKAQYVLTDIKYFLTEGDGMLTDSLEIDQTILTNNTSTTGKYTLDTRSYKDKIVDTSQFTSNDAGSFDIYLKDSIKISVPHTIYEHKIGLSFSQWPYTEYPESLPYDEGQVESIFTITPYTRYVITLYSIRNKIRTGYTATFRDRNTGHNISVDGKWEGTMTTQIYINTVASDIK